MQHGIKLSSLLEEYITGICNCGDITVDVSVRSCSNNRAVYSIQLNGIMATEAALLLVTNTTEGLDLGFAVLFLKEQSNSLESQCGEQNDSDVFSVIIIVIITTMTMSIFLLISIVYCLR